ncbi:DNA-processing protein DprA [Methanolobus bombayensis]|uniref:DNA-processing protein DprA n=1 Tax=Methanolobus bombayensis TaxID=38023 RepID=UPI001AE8FFFD|nr:DNA-processing protein DprA [Methanolobus bombayensis]MBP1908304.1 DNA processing protein [Methanolobus bombayensis]
MYRLIILTLQQTPKIGHTTIEKLMTLSDFSEIETPANIVDLLENAKKEYGRIVVPKLDTVAEAWEKAEALIEKSDKLGIKIVSIFSDDYPRKLLQIKDHPHILHVKGNVEALNSDCIAVVGSRKATDYGISKTKELTSILVKNDYSIVAGLAEGVDAAAHEATLDSNGTTIAVLAHGLDSVYPKSNKHLANAIIQTGGALVSEYPIGTKANKSNFVNRNKIQSGLSSGVIIVQSSIKSGTMHTAKFCKEQGRLLCVLVPSLELLESSKFAGNLQLINEHSVDVVIKYTQDDDFISKLKSKENEQKPKATQQFYLDSF